MDIVITIVEFKNHIKARGYAESTINEYIRCLNKFKAYLKERNLNDLRKVTRQVIFDYRVKVMSEPFAMETKATRIRAVKRLFEYLTSDHKLLINPTEGIVETCRKNRKIGTVLTIDEVKKLLDQPNLSLRTHIRDRAIMEVLYSTGIRLEELISLQVYNADLKDRVLYIRKGKEKSSEWFRSAKALSNTLRNISKRSGPGMGERT